MLNYYARLQMLLATKFGSQEARRIPLSYAVDILTANYFVLSQSMRLTDKQTDRQRDRQTDGRIDSCRQQECALTGALKTALLTIWRWSAIAGRRWRYIHTIM